MLSAPTLLLPALFLAAAPAVSAQVAPVAPVSPAGPISTAEQPVPRDPPRPVGRGPLPTGSTQPLPSTTERPSIGFISAATLADRCESSAAGLVSYCFAYITGVHDTVRAYETWLRVREFCAPFNSAQGDMRRAFLTYLKANPGAGSGEAASVIVLALKDQFACDAPAPAAKAAPERGSKGSQ